MEAEKPSGNWEDDVIEKLRPGRTHEWRGPGERVRMGKLVAIGPTGILQWSCGRLTLNDGHFVEYGLLGRLFGGRK